MTDTHPNQTFTSKKLDLLDALSMDPRLTAAEFRIGYRLAQHMNAETGAIFPSQDRLASQTGMKERTVRSCIAGLIRKGWLHRSRPNRHVPNLYRFDTKHVNAIMDRQTMLNDARREERKLRSRPRDRQLNAAQEDLTGTPMPLGTGSTMPHNTLTLPLKDKLSIEGVNQPPISNDYSRAKDRAA